MSTNKKQPKGRPLAEQARAVAWTGFKYFIGPALIYLAIFFILQPHYPAGFSKSFYLDNGDGFQNVWNIWWVNESITKLGDMPYFTHFLHWPHGTTLIPQTMNIFNGFMGVPLMSWFNLSLVQAVNVAVTFSFVMGGVTMFWLVRHLFNKYAVALVAGGLFTFSSYHFAHAFGHLQLVSLEWIPLFILGFWMMVKRPRYRYALLAAVALLLVLLCDYYYFFWCVMLGAMIFGWHIYKKQLAINTHNIKVLGLFGALAAILCGPLVYALLHLTKVENLLGSHDPAVFALDPITIVVPGGSWYWSTLTSGYWSRIPYLAETSMFFGFGLLTVLGITLYKMAFKNKQFKAPSDIWFWWTVLFTFGLLSLGPVLNIAGNRINLPMPYDLLEILFPTLKLSGMPVRWILVALIAGIIIVSYALSRLDLKNRKHLYLFALFVGISFIDLRPTRLPLTVSPVLPYVHRLAELPDGAVIDNAAVSEPQQLRNQTVYEKPMGFGYVTRLPESVQEKDFFVFAALEEGRGDDLCDDFNIRYVTLPPSRPFKGDAPVIYSDKDALIYDLNTGDGCKP